MGCVRLDPPDGRGVGVSRVEKDMARVPQKAVDGYDGPLRLGTRVLLTDSHGASRRAQVWQEPGPNHGVAVFKMDEPNSGGFREVRHWHGEVTVVPDGEGG